MNIQGESTILLGCTSYIIGGFLNRYFLKVFNLPESVVGAAFLSALVATFSSYQNIEVNIDTSLSKDFILVFFTIIGMSSKLEDISGNRIFYKIVIIVAMFLFLQNLVGIISCYCLGIPTIQGLIMGSITLAGGHGTAVSWGSYFSEEGVCSEAKELGMLFATLGIIAGSITSNLFVSRIINFHNLKPENALLPVPISDKNREWDISLVLKVVFLILSSLHFSKFTTFYIRQYIMLPEYIVCLLVGIMLSQTYVLLNKDNTRNILSLIKEFCLEICVSINIFNLKHVSTSSNIYLLLFVLLIQVIFILFFSYYVFYSYTGENYNSAVLTSGFIGSALGSVAIGANNIKNISQKYGEAPAAMIFFPYLGSVIFDTLNSLIIQIFVLYLTHF